MADSWRPGHKRKPSDASFYDFEDERVQRHSNTRNDPRARKHAQHSRCQEPPAQYWSRSASASLQTVEQRRLFRRRSHSPPRNSSIQRSISGNLSPNNAHGTSETATSTQNPQRQRSPTAQKSPDSQPRGSPELGEAPIPLVTPPRYRTASENLKNRKAMRGDKTPQQPRSNITQAPDEDEIPNSFNEEKPENDIRSTIRESKLRKTLERVPSPESLHAISSASSASSSPASIPQPQRHSPRVQIPVNPAPRRPKAPPARKSIVAYSKARRTKRKQPAATAPTAVHPIPPTSSTSQAAKPQGQDDHQGPRRPDLDGVSTSSPEHAIARSESSSSRTLHGSPYVPSVFLHERLLERAHHVTVTTTATSTSVSYDLLPVERSER